jgi:arylsulfatase A-like enzyme|tara:strand:+ start:4087 stop:4206 length:120 start_codon:yes stop_codon:yes gene_type:complete
MKHRTSLITFTAALFYGIAQAKSPNIDQLALDGVKFTNA